MSCKNYCTTAISSHGNSIFAISANELAFFEWIQKNIFIWNKSLKDKTFWKFFFGVPRWCHLNFDEGAHKCHHCNIRVSTLQFECFRCLSAWSCGCYSYCLMLAWFVQLSTSRGFLRFMKSVWIVWMRPVWISFYECSNLIAYFLAVDPLAPGCLRCVPCLNAWMFEMFGCLKCLNAWNVSTSQSTQTFQELQSRLIY